VTSGSLSSRGNEPTAQSNSRAWNSRSPMFMSKQTNVLITGGAGFIGSHVADELLSHGYRVRVLDNLTPQVHGPHRSVPSYLNPEVEFQCGDVRDRSAVRRALTGIAAVFHFAAAVGVGQSMYEIAEYTSINDLGTANVLQEIIAKPVEALVVASSMSVYGEGLYRDGSGHEVVAGERPLQQLQAGEWEVRNGAGDLLDPQPTPETKPPQLSSIYALSKYDQERMCLITARAYGFRATALRFFNVYGPRQSLSNPYTGVLAIFASRLLNGNRPLVFEDGMQRRDFVSVYDVARACRLALEAPEAAGGVFNIGSGRSVSICEVARKVAQVLGHARIEPQMTGQYRAGDIRHCFADVTLAHRSLGFTPEVDFGAGIEDLALWLKQQSPEDRVAEACAELSTRGLTV
jgi:dTDP-L-rhamnose 4-epimerase